MIEGNILVIGAHADDTILGAGATMSAALRWGCRILDLTFSRHKGVVKNYTTSRGIAREHSKALKTIGKKRLDSTLLNFEACNGDMQRRCSEIRALMEGARSVFQPSVVITHSRLDSNQDHVLVYEEAYRTFKGKSSILTFDFIPNTMRMGKPQFLVQVTGEDVSRKALALDCYKSQSGDHHPYMSARWIEAQARMHGVEAGSLFAEAFHVESIIMGDVNV